MTTDPIQTLTLHGILARLGVVKKIGKDWQAKCPAHEDHRASLSVGEGDDGRVLLHCHAGCTLEAIIAALDVKPAQLFPPNDRKPLPTIVATYDYLDLDGRLRYQVCRFEPKDFRQRQPSVSGGFAWNMTGVKRIPYRLNELKGHALIYIAEGEKDVDALWRAGMPATTNVGGAGKWRDSDSIALKAVGVQRVVILPDNDVPGRKHAQQVTESVKDSGMAAVTIELPDLAVKEDVSEWLRLGHQRTELEALVNKALWLVPKSALLGHASTMTPEPEIPRWHLTDLGAAEAFTARFREMVRYDHRQERWLVWDQHLWQPDATKQVRRLAHEHARAWQQEAVQIKDFEDRTEILAFATRLEKRSGIDNMLYMAHSLLPIADDGLSWDTNGMLLGCQNGVVDLVTGDLLPGRPADHITLQTNVAYDANALCPRWYQFINEIFSNDLDIIAYVQRALGYSLTNDMREQCFFLCIGAGSNGKSTFLSTLNAIWGTYAYTTDMRTFADQPGTQDSSSFNLAELATRRLVLASEAKTNSRLNEEALKNFTGGEKMNAQRKYGHPFEYLPTGKIWLGMNHQPRVFDDSYGFWRRVRLIPFLRTFQGSSEDQNLRQTLVAEGPGILAWAVRGCLEWQQLGLNPPASVSTATEAYQQSEDPLTDFLTECVSSEDGAESSASFAYTVYKDWAKNQGFSEREMLSATSFGRLFGKHFYRKHTVSGKKYQGVRIRRQSRDLLDN